MQNEWAVGRMHNCFSSSADKGDIQLESSLSFQAQHSGSIAFVSGLHVADIMYMCITPAWGRVQRTGRDEQTTKSNRLVSLPTLPCLKWKMSHKHKIIMCLYVCVTT